MSEPVEEEPTEAFELSVQARPRPGALKILVRVVVGAGVFAILLVRTDLDALVDELSQARAGYVVGGVALFFSGIGVSALRWREYLIALEIRMQYATLYRLYFVGTFFNAFLPTGIGGDAYKAVRIGRVHGRFTPAFASVFLDRFAGVVGLAVIGLVLALVRLAQDDGSRVPPVALVICVGILGAAGLVLGPGERLFGRRGRLVPLEGIGGKIRGAARAIHAAGRHPRAAAAGLALGFGFQLAVLAYHLTLARALGITQVPVAAMSGIVVISSVATLIPLSISGLGFLEGSYVWALGTYGVRHDTAIAFALLVRAVLILSSAAGGVVYLILGGEVRPEDAPLESEAIDRSSRPEA